MVAVRHRDYITARKSCLAPASLRQANTVFQSTVHSSEHVRGCKQAIRATYGATNGLEIDHCAQCHGFARSSIGVYQE